MNTNGQMTRRNALGAAAAMSAVAATATAGIAHAQTSDTGRTRSHSLEGKVALVTGAARGIGRAISEAYVREGASVAMLDIADPSAFPAQEGFRAATEEEFDEAVASARAIGANVLKIKADVRVEDAMAAAVTRIQEAFGGLDIAVANAGYVRWHPFMEGTATDWKSVYDVNVHGVFNTFKAGASAMQASGGGSLIALSSVGGRQGVPGNGAYTSSKWAVIGLVKQAALELGPDMIAANAIAPGAVDTPMYRSEGQKRSMNAQTDADQDQIVGPGMPLGDAGALRPEEIADGALYLAKANERGISGTVLDIAHGYNAAYTG